MALKEIESLDSTFIANGNKYYIHVDISIERYRIYEELQYLIAFGMNINELSEALKKIIGELSGDDVIGSLHRIHQIATNALYSAGRQLNEREHEVLLFSTLFINREGEDVTTWNEALAKEKIEDWSREGISMTSFFLLATRQLKGLQQLWDTLLQEKAGDQDFENLMSRMQDLTSTAKHSKEKGTKPNSEKSS